MHHRASQLIRQLDLQPHPEGGFFREIMRSDLPVHSDSVVGIRPAYTDIYFLLVAGQVSHWHRVRHDEIWHFYEGSPLRLLQLSANLEQLSDQTLDPALCRYQQVVPRDCWQAAETLGDYTLVGCTVAPGFDFADFCMLKELPEIAAKVYRDFPDLGRFVTEKDSEKYPLGDQGIFKK